MRSSYLTHQAIRDSQMCRSNPPAVTGICDPSKSRAWRHKSKLPLTVSRSYNTNARLTYLNNKLFSHELKILNYDELWENKKIRG